MKQITAILLLGATAAAAETGPWKPYSAPCVERENVFEFAEKPHVKVLGNDKYEITFIPEAYRHSIGVVDTAGNLVMHIGQYGNFDSGYGPSSKIPVGGDGIAFSDARMVSGTDRHLAVADRGDRLLVLKLNYHAEETASIGGL